MVVHQFTRKEAFNEMKHVLSENGSAGFTLVDQGKIKADAHADLFVFLNKSPNPSLYPNQTFTVSPITGRFVSDDGSEYGKLRMQVIQTGRVKVDGDNQYALVTFPIAYEATPHVVISPITSVPGTTVLGVGTAGINAQDFGIHMKRTNTTDTEVCWMSRGRIKYSYTYK